MKSSSDIRNELFLLVRLLQEADIALYINPVAIQFLSKGIERVTWASPIAIQSSLFMEEPATIDMYCAWLEGQAFSAILFDGSILQFSYDIKGNSLKSHRLLYFPCPFDVDRDLLTSEPLLDVISLYRGKDDGMVKLRTPFRFDFDSNAQKEGHPAAHLTILWNHCRWAVVAPLSPGHFLRFIFKNFYPHLWDAHDFLRNWPQSFGDRTITTEEENNLHISCSRESFDISEEYC